MSDKEYCRLCDSPVASAYDSYCKAHDAEDEIIQLERQLDEAREALNIDIGDLIMVDGDIQFVSSIVSDPVVKFYYWVENEELSVTENEIECHFLNVDRYREQLKEQG